MVRKCTLTFSCLKSQPIWLSGPGCSSVGGGAFTELGPFYPRGDGRGLRSNKKSWNRGRSLGCRYISIPFFFSKEWKVQVLTFSLLLCCFYLLISQRPIFCSWSHRLELDGLIRTLHRTTALETCGLVSCSDSSLNTAS